MSSAKQAKPTDRPMFALLAGGVAGAVEATVTYPTEYVKTQLQLQHAASTAKRFTGPIDCLTWTVREKGFTTLYRGLSAMVIGTAAKAAIRFVSYERYKSWLVDDRGRLSGPKAMLAGMGAGMTEAILVVTPSETIKTRLIHDANLAKPRYNHGMLNAVSLMVKEEGLRGIYRGLLPVMARQGANQAVRFSVYSSLKQLVQVTPDAPVSPIKTFLIGMVAGTVTVYTTMPLDVIKTKIQGADAKARYNNSALRCILATLREEGIRAFWRGSTPRLSRLMFSGGIVFTVYEQVSALLNVLSPPPVSV